MCTVIDLQITGMDLAKFSFDVAVARSLKNRLVFVKLEETNAHIYASG